MKEQTMADGAMDAADLFPGIEGLTLDTIFAPSPWA